WLSRSGRCRAATPGTAGPSGRPSRPRWSPAPTRHAAASTCRTAPAPSAGSTAPGPAVGRSS
ncbi:MAG: LSU ribosomal protein L32p @ LSU ribosomal protein L32p, zinc-dependent, partial [uncultured Nocardioidaceae bacterium]